MNDLAFIEYWNSMGKHSLLNETAMIRVDF
jgi:hypothetical protein